MYKMCMANSISVHTRWHKAQTATAPQLLTCAYCVLVRWDHDDLSAPYWRWYWNDKPGAYLILKGKRMPLLPGRVTLIPPHTAFSTGCDRPVGHFFMHFTLGLDRAVTPGQIFTHHPPASEQALIRRLIRFIQQDTGAHALSISFLAQAAVNPALAAVPAAYWKGHRPDRRMEQALNRIRGNPAAIDANVALARETGMNVSAFTRKFRQAVGHTPHQYRLRLRVEHARAWLREGIMTIEEVATKSGFCDRFHFSRVFKRVMGVSPAAFRRQMTSASPRLVGRRTNPVKKKNFP